MIKNEHELHEAFEDALSNLQYVLIARRVQASDESVRLSWRHFDIMAMIKKHGSVMPSTISEDLKMSRSSTSKYLKSLEGKGLIEKSEGSLDRRSHYVKLSVQASEILDNIYKGQHENAHRAQQVLSPQEVEQFIAIATKVTTVLDDDSLRSV